MTADLWGWGGRWLETAGNELLGKWRGRRDGGSSCPMRWRCRDSTLLLLCAVSSVDSWLCGLAGCRLWRRWRGGERRVVMRRKSHARVRRWCFCVYVCAHTCAYLPTHLPTAQSPPTLTLTRQHTLSIKVLFRPRRRLIIITPNWTSDHNNSSTQSQSQSRSQWMATDR